MRRWLWGILAAAGALALPADEGRANTDPGAMVLATGRWCNGGGMLIITPDLVTWATLDGTPQEAWHVIEFKFYGQNIVIEITMPNGTQAHSAFIRDAETLTEIGQTGSPNVLRRCG